MLIAATHKDAAKVRSSLVIPEFPKKIYGNATRTVCFMPDA
jgi:hypothetical protein